jgi:HEAT repeat protein
VCARPSSRLILRLPLRRALSKELSLRDAPFMEKLLPIARQACELWRPNSIQSCTASRPPSVSQRCATSRAHAGLLQTNSSIPTFEQLRESESQIDGPFGDIVASLHSFKQGILLKLRGWRGFAILSVLGLLVIGLVAPQLLHTPEPAYGGKTVSAWIRELGRSGGSYGIRVSDSGPGNSIRLLRSLATNSALFPISPLYLPNFMQPKPGVTNVYIIDESAMSAGVLMSLVEMGVLSVTNALVSSGTRTNAGFLSFGALPLPARTWAGSSGGGITILPGPMKPGPGLNLIRVYRDAQGDPIHALEAIGAPALPYLDKALRKQNGPFRNVYLRAYRLLGRWAERFLPEPSPDAVFTRRAVADALARLPVGGTPSSAALLADAKDPDRWVRDVALYALDRRSEQDPAIVPALTKSMLELPVSEFVEWVEKGGLSGPATVRALMAALKQGDATVRANAISLLRKIGPKAKLATSALLLTLKDEDCTVRALACEALGVLEGDAQLVVPTLIQALSDPDYWVRRHAAESLGRYHADAKAAVPRLLELRDATNNVEQYYVHLAIRQIDSEAAHKAGLE